MVGSVLGYLTERIGRGPVHLTLIDPDKSRGPAAAAVARAAVDLGSDAIMLGGSTGISPARMGEAARAVRAAVEVPTIIFPEGPGSLSPDAHAIFFMSLLNSRKVDFVIRAQAASSEAVRRLGIEPISLGYLVIDPGMRVGEVGEVDPIARTDIAGAQGYALAAEMLGMRLVYLEAGSGAPEPVPPEMVRAVRSSLTVPLVVGGGIRTGADARRLLDAGAQALVTGSITEEEGVGPAFRDILGEVKRARGG